MTIEEQRAACARFRGYELYKNFCGTMAYTNSKTRLHECTVFDYHPDLDIQQANELWKKIDDTYHWSLENDPVGNKHFCIMDKKYNVQLSGYDILAMGKGPTWSSALVEAVAKLQAAKEKK